MAIPHAASAGPLARVRQRAFRHAPDDVGAVVLRHSRIYILPTPRGIAVIFTLFTMLLGSLQYGLSLGFIVTFLLTGLVGASLLHTFRNLAGIEIAPIAAAETFKGAPLAYTLSLDGHGSERTAIALRAGDASATVDVPADGRLRTTLDTIAMVRGRVPLGRVTASSDFPLGLWRAWAYVHFPLAGLAYPTPELGAPPLPAGRGDGDDDGNGRNEDADLAGLRTYQPGDPLQRVAWKAVARGGGWYTKEFEGGRSGAVVALDWSALVLDDEARLSRLAAWVLACERSLRPYALRLPGTSLPAGLGRDQRHAALAALALYEAAPR